MTPECLYEVRGADPSDESFIFATWLQSLYFGSPFFRETEKESYFKNYAKVVETILKLSTTTIAICCLKEQKDVVLGYSVSTGQVLHFVYVKKPWRQLGIAKMLIRPDTHTVTHQTRISRSIKPREWVFDPFAI